MIKSSPFPLYIFILKAFCLSFYLLSYFFNSLVWWHYIENEVENVKQFSLGMTITLGLKSAVDLVVLIVYFCTENEGRIHVVLTFIDIAVFLCAVLVVFLRLKLFKDHNKEFEFSFDTQKTVSKTYIIYVISTL